MPKIGEAIPGTNLLYEAEDIANINNNLQADQTTITTETLTPDKPIELPKYPTDNSAAGILAGGEALMKQISDRAKEVQAEQAQRNEDLMSNLLKTPEAPTSTEDLYSEAYKTSGVEQKSQDVITAQADLDLIDAQLKDITASAQAQKLQNEKLISGGTAGSADFLNRQNQEIDRQAAIRALPLQAQALSKQAILTKNQNALRLAQDKLDTLFKLKSEDADRKYNYDKELRDRVFEYSTKKEQQKIDALQKEDDRAFELYKIDLKKVSDLSSEAMKNGQGDLAAQIAQLDPSSPDFQIKLGALQGQIQIKDETVNSLILKYPDAGILPTDDLATASAKLKNSRIYQEQVRPPKGTDEEEETGDTMFDSIMQAAIDAGASPDLATLKAVEYAESKGIQISEKERKKILARAKTLKKTEEIIAPTAPPKTAEELGRATGETFKYLPGAMWQTVSTPFKAASSFFKGLFGG